MPSTKSEVEDILDGAIGLLLTPTLANLGKVENLLGLAVTRLSEQGHPDPAGGAVGLAVKVRLCGRLLEGAEARRPGCGGWGYDVRGERPRPATSKFAFEI